MDYIKDAFQKVKQDTDSLKEQILSLKELLEITNRELNFVRETNLFLSSKIRELEKEPFGATSTQNPTNTQENPTASTQNPTDNSLFMPQNTQKFTFSTGNRGVPTDRQTNQQTNQQTEKMQEKASLNDAFEVLNSLDSIKREIRNKFKRITEQEFLVFSTIYQLTESQESVEYKDLSQRLNLTESSIRDYVGRLIKKGIPVEKTKINNKIIHLSISENLRKITPLPVILHLRTL